MSAQGDLWRLSATDLAAAFRSGSASAREIVEAHLGRIAATNDALNAITRVLGDEALAEADAQDAARARGDALGPLAGVPMTVKENVDVAGSATTQNVPVMKDVVPPIDAPHVAQLKRAGAIVIGRTNLPEFALRWHTDGVLNGPTVNPWDAGRTPGGSSGGDAAALAAGMTPLGNGNDYGGSLRVPSQFCGTTAIRPTYGRVADHSAVAPGELSPSLQTMAVQGPMARHVRDLRLALEACSGRDARDPSWTPAPLDGAPADEPLRVAMCADPGGLGVHPDVAQAVSRAGAALADAGFEVEEVALPAVERAAVLWLAIVFTDIRSMMLPVMRPILGADAIAFLEAGLALVPDLSLIEYQRAVAERKAVAREWAQFHDRYPIVLSPACSEPAFAVGADLTGEAAPLIRAMRMLIAINLLGLPSAAVPTGVANGLPQGVQLIGDRYREDLCLGAAQAIEDRLGVITPVDPVAG